MLPNFPKVHCPFERVEFKIDKDDWKEHGADYQLRTPKVYLVMPNTNPEHDMEWVFEKDTYAVEKMHGTNVAVEIKDQHIASIQNRLNPIDFTKVIGKKDGLPPSARFLEGILAAAQKKYLKDDCVQYGELIGPSLNQNIHKLPSHIFYPFEVAEEKLRYKSFNAHPKEFWGWCEWFRLHLKSMLYCRMNGINLREMYTNPDVPFTEGIVIYQRDHVAKRRRMAKLRRDMFYWYYCDKIRILDLPECFIDHARMNGIYSKGYSD